ncbi:DUF4212 domain-containing protein [Noviherbaspirillum sp. UKPF54]|uniref:DUF4212 domain-containing protein n=1 Tax=Noviherbaspirillum sp. UKPF54 TaxID=2601898 RepID=UPI0011B132B4|nr:DUF4212 domain-containing protein [Noviherbaspirillum sp. UKPF54]QDZ28778.1 DUF4212 domain-containing protein [Noviherbaspirillum sp. UKPF54]
MSQEPLSIRHPRDAYWRQVRRLTAVLLASWFLLTFVVIFFARELSGVTLFGWPLPFYMAAQGLTLLYLAIVAIYMIRMRRLDRQLKSDTTNAR